MLRRLEETPRCVFLTRKYTPYVDDFSGSDIDKDEQRYTVEVIKATEKRGQFVKSNKLDMSHTTFKKMFIDKLGDGVLTWTTLTKMPDGKWESTKA